MTPRFGRSSPSRWEMQRELFLLTAAEETPAYFSLFMTLAGTGMRLGEALALQ
jgi:hypothetical protein